MFNVYTRQNMSHRGHREDEHDIDSSLDVSRGNCLDLLHMRYKEIPWLQVNSQLKHHQQWTSWKIHIELFQIITDRQDRVSISVLVICTKEWKRDFVGFFETTNAKSFFNLAKSLDLDLKNIVDECFDGVSNTCGLWLSNINERNISVFNLCT